MDFTINCTRVPIPEGTTLYGIPLESGPAPASSGPASDHDAPTNASNDGAALNLSRRALPDGEEPGPIQNSKSTIIGCKKHTIVSSLNVRTLGPLGRLDELINSAKACKTDILAIQEHRFFHPKEPLKYHQASPFQLVTSSSTKNSSNSSVGGVGFLLSPRACDNLLGIESISPRIMILTLRGNPKTTVICVYSPHNSSSEEDIVEFYNTLRTTVEQVPLHNLLIVTGDLNAKLGPDDARFTYNTRTNRNGDHLVDFMEEYNLFPANTSFMKPKGQLWTFEYPNGDRAQLDYLLVRKKWRNSVKDSRSYSSFSSVGSDHRVISARIKLSLRVSKRAVPNPMKRIDWKEVSTNSELSKNFAIQVFNKFQSLSSSEINADNVEEIYSHLIKSTEEVALATLPKKKTRSQSKPSASVKVADARCKLKSSSLAYHKHPSQSNKIKMIMAKKELEDSYLDAEVDYISGKISDLTKHHISKKHHLAWRTVKDLAGKNATSTVRLKGGSAKKRLENWSKHFQSLLGKEAKLPENYTLPSIQVSQQLNISTSLFTLKELLTVIKQLKSSKAFGPDNIPALLWKDEHFSTLLLNLCNHTFRSLSPPKIWRTSQIIPVPKKGDLSLATNYRGISLMSIAAKIYNKLILNRLIPFVEPILRKNQNGFRRGRSTLSQILCLRRLIEESNASKVDLALVFVDFSKAFDSVDRSKMFEILKLYGIPEEIVAAIKVMYTDSTSTVMSSDGETQPFPTLAGILQGDTLAPFLFIMVVDYVMRVSVDKIAEKGYQLQPKKDSRHPAKHLTDTDFADDIALISQSLEHVQDLLQSLEQASNGVGLYLNETKTECLNRCLSDADLVVKTLSGSALKMVEDYVYLGSFISSSEKDFNTRKGMAWSACNDMHKIWTSQLPKKIKLQIFRATVEPILLYGSETWTLSKKLEKRLDGTYTRLLMRAQNLSWKRHPSISDIYGNLPRVSALVRSRRVQFAGHCYRAESEVISSLLLWKSSSDNAKGRKLSFPEVISRDTGIRTEDLGWAMQDRDVWRGIVNSMKATKVEQ